MGGPIGLFVGLLALVLGFKHSYDTDHLVAVSNILVKSKTLNDSVRVSVSWAGGHMITATSITLGLYWFRDSFFPQLSAISGLLVGPMLVVLGMLSLISVFHWHGHPHDDGVHSHPHFHGPDSSHSHHHKRMFGIGVIQGLASNDELLILMTALLGLSTITSVIAGVAIFSAGVVLGMVVFGLILSFSMSRVSGVTMNKMINVATGGVSVAYGVFLLV